MISKLENMVGIFLHLPGDNLKNRPANASTHHPSPAPRYLFIIHHSSFIIKCPASCLAKFHHAGRPAEQ